MKWEDLPWHVRQGPAAGLLQFCDQILLAATDSPRETEFLRQQLPEIANESALQWCGIVQRQPEFAAVAEFGRRPSPDLPIAFLAAVLDRESAAVATWPGNAHAVLAAPLRDRNGVYALLVCAGRGLNEAHVAPAVAVARVLGYALRMIRDKTALQQQVERLRATLAISSQFAAARDSQSLLEMIAREATRLLQADRASIFIWDKEAKQVVACPALGVDGSSLRLPDDAGIVGEVLRTGAPIRVRDAYDDPRFNKEVDASSGFRTRSLLCVPLLAADGQRIGAFEVMNKLEGAFTAGDEQTLTDLGVQAAIALHNTREREDLIQRHRQLTEQVTQGVRIIGESPPIVALQATIERLARNDLPVLILGESGTGKEVVCQALHYRGPRRDHPFIAVNCAALPESLLESELFGHERGAFTDAQTTRQGKFELAHGGTLFLDEIGEMSLGGQSKLLRVLEQKVITRVGGSQPIPIDVRIVAATNVRLSDAVRERRFREDLYYRLSVVTLEIPPLRERPQDILLLAEYFLQQFCRQARRPGLTLSDEARRRLQGHAWPGNVRELRNLMERVAFLTTGERVEAEDLAFTLSPDAGVRDLLPDDLGLSDATDAFQIEFIRKAIRREMNNMSHAAERLGLHRSNLYRKMRQLDMKEVGGTR